MRKLLSVLFLLVLVVGVFGCTQQAQVSEDSSEASGLSADVEAASDDSDLDAASAEEDDLGDII